ncbi:MAG: glycosyltransferase family 39 protein [Candidatus Omnitrophica bacterium]|nr:glycosyltransferase family 39 protein [Candidatus Omnitrophota bacterium]MBU1996906.1 glycosyltransferase family 39 protein [Candidatus Omnitrophota bacterium]
MKKDLLICIAVFFVGIFVFSQGLGQHGLEYRDDEIFYYQSTKEMVNDGNYMSPTYFGQNRFQKPILFYWLIVLSYKVLGVNWFAARFVSVIFACLSLVVTWLIAKRLFDGKTATLSSGILMTVPMFLRHAKNAVPDMALNFFIVLAVYYAILVIEEEDYGKNSILFFVSCGLGFMIKGFAALIIPFMVVFIYAFLNKKQKILSRMSFGRGALILLLVTLPWFIFMIVKHGSTYIDYMLIDETKNRLLDNRSRNSTKHLVGLLSRVGFYFQVLMSYFAPWGIFLFGAIPLAISKHFNLGSSQGDVLKEKRSFVLMLIWFFSVFSFFSIMSFRINHYMLVLSTPFAILISKFFLWEIDVKGVWVRSVYFVRRYLIILFIAIGTFAFSFLVVFLLGKNNLWIAIYVLMFVLMAKACLKRNAVFAPAVLSLFLMFVFAQSSLMGEANVTPHSAFQRFANTIKEDPNGPVAVAVGSNDIHEKEFQVYFDEKVIKAANDSESETGAMLFKFFNDNDKAYCLLTEEDFKKALNSVGLESLRIVQNEYIFRRRMYIDKGFFIGLLQFDDNKVRDYLMEKVVLVRKDKNA